MALDEAIEAPRLHVEGTHLSLEGGLDSTVAEHLENDFEDMTAWDARNLFFGGVHAVGRQNGQLTGHGDSRRDGVCLKVG